MTVPAVSPLRRRMIEDMAIRKFAPKTQHDYVQRVKDFARFLSRSPDTHQPRRRACFSTASEKQRVVPVCRRSTASSRRFGSFSM
jgi:hypothetical protein